MQIERYFDHAATTPLLPDVFDAMLPWLRDGFGNPHSVHALGLSARDAVEAARTNVAEMLGVDPMQIVFTSGATESNNWVLSAFDRIAISPFEHSSVRNPALYRGAQVMEGSTPELRPPESCELVSVISVDSETGAQIELPSIDSGFVHRDITQSAGKIEKPICNEDFASLSAHKINGPKGVGALYAKADWPRSIHMGGGQEDGHRSGTLNVAGIVGFGAAAAWWNENREQAIAQIQSCRLAFLEALRRGTPLSPPDGFATILAVAFPRVLGEALVIGADSHGFAISAGPACSSASNELSPVLLAHGFDEEAVRSSVRISFGHQNTPDSARQLAQTLDSEYERLAILR